MNHAAGAGTTHGLTAASAPSAGEHQLPSSDDVSIRRILTQGEYDACVLMQHEIWGASFTEVVPAAILRVSQKIGGVTAGAFDSDGKLLGFVFGLTGVQDRRLVHWSDILAVSPAARNRGVARRLKFYQRELVSEIGVEKMYWTYDPLVAKNAYLNLIRLGARPIQYVVNMYGPDMQSTLQGALGTDRFIVEWDLRAPVRSAEETASEMIRVEIPSDIQQVMATDPAAAKMWRETTREALMSGLADGYTVNSFSRPTADGPCYYTLTAPSR